MSDIEIRFGYRRTGRTTHLIDWLIEGEGNPEGKRVIYCHAQATAKSMFEKAKERCDTVQEWQFRTVEQPGPFGAKISEVAIDNLELYIGKLVHHIAPVAVVTATLAQEHPQWGKQHGFNVRATY